MYGCNYNAECISGASSAHAHEGDFNADNKSFDEYSCGGKSKRTINP